ncbi:MAG: hypothetical protein M3410_16605 [Acidobacteriota bacterium]|nr:hypothetical protein [Acidobacteriota bacterium]
MHFGCSQLLDRTGDRLGARRGRGDRTGILGQAFPDFFDALVLCGIGKLRTARHSEGERIADCTLTVFTRLTERARQRPPLEPQPDSPLDGVQMRILSARGDEPELWLNPVEELVQHQDPSCASIQGGREVPHVGGPMRTTPVDRRIHEPKGSRLFRCRARLVCGERSRPCVGEHHRPAQGDAPESPTVALTDGGCLLEVGFSTLLIEPGLLRD